MAITSKIRKQGGAAVMTIPPAVLKLMRLEIGVEVALSVEHGKLVAQSAVPPRKRYSVAELLKGADAMRKLNAEVAWALEGDPVGQEIG